MVTSPGTPGAPTPSAGRTIQLSVSGLQARILPDEHDDGHVLEVGGMIQSHVDLAEPTRIRYDYLARMAAVLDHAFPAGSPLRALHLGAGALTLPRYVQATRPGSPQVTVELERELPSLVTTELPLPPGTDLTVVIEDARAALAELPVEPFDVVVLDIYTGEDSAPHLTGQDFYAELLARLSPGGLLLVNIGDDAGLAFFARQARALEAATQDAGLTGAWTLADATLVQRHETGNLVLGAGGALSTPGATRLIERLQAAGPHPAAVLDPDGTATLLSEL